MTWPLVFLVAFVAALGGMWLGTMLGSNARSYLEDEVQHWRKRYMDSARDQEHA